MESIRIPSFVSRKEKLTCLTRLELFSAMVDDLACEREYGVDVTVALMKSLAYLTPIPGLSYLNGMFDTLKDLVFHLHTVNGKSKKIASLDVSSPKRDIFSEDVRENLIKLLHLQSLLKKEHENCVKMFERNAFALKRLETEIEESQSKMSEFRHIPFEDRTNKDDRWFHFHYSRVRLNKAGLLQVGASSKMIEGREQVLQDQLKTLSVQLAILTESQMRPVLKSSIKQLLKIAEDTGAARDLLDEIETIKPGSVVHQMYLAASDIYVFPSEPQKLVYCPECGVCTIKGTANEHMLHLIHTNGANSNNNASVEMNASWHADVYMKSEMKFKSQNERELKLSTGDMVKAKLLSSDSAWAFGWKRSFAGTKKRWGFFPTIVASRIDGQPLL